MHRKPGPDCTRFCEGGGGRTHPCPSSWWPGPPEPPPPPLAVTDTTLQGGFRSLWRSSMLGTTWASKTTRPLEDGKVHRAMSVLPPYTHGARYTPHPQWVLGKRVCHRCGTRSLDSPALLFPAPAVGSESTVGYLRDEAGPGHPGKLLGGGQFSWKPGKKLHEGRASLILPTGWWA